MENQVKSREYKFPLAIKVNVWLVLIWPILLLILFVMAILFNSSEFTDMVREIIYDDESPVQSILFDLQILVVTSAIWIIYFQKKYVQYIVKIFYINYAFTMLLSLPSFFNEPVSIISIALFGWPVLWLYMSKDVKEFMRGLENE